MGPVQLWTLTNQPHIAPTNSASDSDPNPKGKGRIVEVEIDTEDDDVEVMEAPRVRPRPTKRIKARVGMSTLTQIPHTHQLTLSQTQPHQSLSHMPHSQSSLRGPLALPTIALNQTSMASPTGSIDRKSVV